MVNNKAKLPKKKEEHKVIRKTACEGSQKVIKPAMTTTILNCHAEASAASSASCSATGH